MMVTMQENIMKLQLRRKFLDPLADKILVSSAFISFALLGIIDFWMVGIIIFRDLFVTGLRMAMEQNGKPW